MLIELLTVPGCPHRAMALARVLTALDQVAGSGVEVVERVIDDPVAAEAAGMHGSPTVLIDGRDPFAHGADPCGSVSCRLYRTPVGVEGAPGVDALADALIRAG